MVVRRFLAQGYPFGYRRLTPWQNAPATGGCAQCWLFRPKAQTHPVGRQKSTCWQIELLVNGARGRIANRVDLVNQQESVEGCGSEQLKFDTCSCRPFPPNVGAVP